MALVVICPTCGSSVPVVQGVARAACPVCTQYPSVPATDAELAPHFDALDVYDQLAETEVDNPDDTTDEWENPADGFREGGD